jgi:hypothetical protein
MNKLYGFGGVALAVALVTACGATADSSLIGSGANGGTEDGGSASAPSNGNGDGSGNTLPGPGDVPTHDAGPAASDGGPASAGDAGGATPPPPGAGIPCDVAAMLAAKCTTCHADPPVNGSLAGLMTVADLMARAKEDPARTEAELSVVRMESAAAPMPPAGAGSPATAAEIQSFKSWIAGNYAGSCADAGAPPPPPPDVFTGAPAYVSTVSASSHNAGQDCMNGCHNHGFTFAGTLTDGNGKGLAGAEVRLVDASGKAISVHTSANGNFHSSTSFAAPARVGARNAASKAIMVTSLTAANGGCNSCHATGASTLPIHLP